MREPTGGATEQLRDVRYGVVLAATLALLCAGAASVPAGRGPTRDLVVAGTLVTMDDRLGVVRDGRLVIADGRIAAVLRRGEPLPGVARSFPSVRVQGFVYPGLVNAHNHLAFGTLPPWRVPLVNGEPLRDDDDWRAGHGAYAAVTTAYAERLARPKYRLMEEGLAEEVGKWAELKELAAGTTTTQGSFGFRAGGDEDNEGFAHHLARNLDLDPELREGVPGIYDEEHDLHVDILERALADLRAGRAHTFVLHLSEGRTELKRRELDDLAGFGRAPGARCGPLLRRAVVIHGTPYGRRELGLMADCGADLVASPLGNLLLYGTAPDLLLGVDAGVNVSLGSDWSAVGSRNVLEELKVADHLLGGRVAARTLVEMVTRNPARAIGWGGRVGRLAPGLYGDVVALRTTRDDPYRALVAATERDVALVAVGGDPVLGDVDLMRQLKPGDHDVVDSGCGFTKAVDVTTSLDVAEGADDLGTIETSLRRGSSSAGVDPESVSPLFTCADRAHLDMVESSGALDHFDPAAVGLAARLRTSFGVR